MLTRKIRVKNKLYNFNIPYSIIAAFFAVLLLLEVFLSIYYYIRFDSFFVDAKKKELVRTVDAAYAACSYVIDSGKSGKIDIRKAENYLIYIISGMANCNEAGWNYLFLLKKDGTILVNPVNNTIPETNSFYLTDREGKNYINEIVNIAYSDKKKGFVKLVNEHSEESGSKLKICYVRSLPSLNYIIGSGAYVDRTSKDQKSILFPMIAGSVSILILIMIVAALSLLNIKKNLRILEISEKIFKSIFNSIDHLICLLDSQLNVLILNRTALRFIGSEEKKFEGTPFVKLPVWTDIKGSRDKLLRTIERMERGTVERCQILSRDADGKDRAIDFSIYPLDYGENHPRLFVADGKDISELKEKEIEIYRFAFTDQITNLPNEQLFSQMISGFINTGDQSGAMLAVIKLSNLSFVNSMLGFEMGNVMLKAFTERLIHISSAGCIVAKFTGGNFSIYIPPNIVNTKKEEIFKSFGDLCANKALPLKFGEYEMHLSVNIGIASFPEHGSDYNELLHSAMIAKDDTNNGINQNFRMFNHEIADKVRRKARIEEAVRSSGFEDSMNVHFQPQINLKTGKIDSFEALARWNDAKIGHVSPVEFIPIAEKIGAINRIFAFVLAKSGHVAKKLDFHGIRISVNVSVVQLVDEVFPEILMSTIEKCGVAPSSIAIEITESILIESFDTILSKIKMLKSKGFMIYLDDFGTGFSSLSYLRNLPVDILKLDKTFIHGIDSDEKTAALVGSIIRIAHELGMKVVAEGVETREQAMILKGIDCDFSQGWYTGKPVMEEAALDMIINPENFNINSIL